MSTTTTKSATFERFLDALRGTNPFQTARITDPDGDEPTVESVHEKPFRQLERAVDRARTNAASSGVLLLGGPGVGKSHLLARLFRAAGENRATVVYLHNVLASPDRMLRYLLSATVSDLAGARPARYPQSRLYAVLNRALVETGAKKYKATAAGIAARGEALTLLGQRESLDDDVVRALTAFLAGTSDASLGDEAAERHAEAAVDWLAGETLGPEEATLLGRRTGDEGVALADDEAVTRVFDGLSRFCALAARPLVLCLDQVDNLQPEPARALASYVHALLDRTKHLVVVVSGVKESLLRFREENIISAAAWDRIAESTLELHRISVDEARAILGRRIAVALAGFEEQDCEEVVTARRKDALFPLGSAWFDGKVGAIPELRARDAILWARDRWESQQERVRAAGGARWLAEWPGPEGATGPVLVKPDRLEDAIDVEMEKKLVEGVNRRSLQPASLPADADNMASLTHELLRRCIGHDAYTVVDAARPPAPGYHLLVGERRADGVRVATGVTFLATPNGSGAHGPLKRMADDPQAPAHRILVTDEERRPLKLGAAGKAHYDRLAKLSAARFLHLKLGFAHHAELDSLVGLLGAAKSGDLEIEHPRGQYRRVTEDEVMASFRRKSRLLAHPLLRELLTEEIARPTSPPPNAQRWDPQGTREHVMAELSWRLGLMARELADIFARRHKVPKARTTEFWAHVKDVARSLHDEGLVHATAQDSDLFVQLRKPK